ncbi:D-alanine--poly(phosphoribitol) ligase subunit 2 [compost metagenome]
MTILTEEQNEIMLTVKGHLLNHVLFGYAEEDLDPDSSFLELGILDSTGIMELVSMIESHFDVEVLDSEIIPENLDSLRCIAAFVWGKQHRDRG